MLAAGRSRRMGRQKLLLPWGGGTVISTVVDEVLRAGLSRVVLVVGEDEPRLRDALAGRAVEVVRNPDAEGEMLGSVRCGLRALTDREAALVVLGDQPALRAEWIVGMLCAFDGSSIVVPVCGGKRGHPMLLPRRLWSEVLEGLDGRGLKGLIDAHPEAVREWAVDDRRVLSDLDTPADYARETGAGGVIGHGGGSA